MLLRFPLRVSASSFIPFLVSGDISVISKPALIKTRSPKVRASKVWPLTVWIADGVLFLYKALLSPFFGGRCRFYPSCSQYARDAICTYGLVRGIYRAASRVSRCHPANEGGYDPVEPDPAERDPVQQVKRSDYRIDGGDRTEQR